LVGAVVGRDVATGALVVCGVALESGARVSRGVAVAVEMGCFVSKFLAKRFVVRVGFAVATTVGVGRGVGLGAIVGRGVGRGVGLGAIVGRGVGIGLGRATGGFVGLGATCAGLGRGLGVASMGRSTTRISFSGGAGGFGANRSNAHTRSRCNKSEPMPIIHSVLDELRWRREEGSWEAVIGGSGLERRFVAARL